MKLLKLIQKIRGGIFVAPKTLKYECNLCGYIYDPTLGDPENGINPGTPFAELPDNWVCPLCGAGKDEFSQIDD
jgi:rubredoxin